MPTAATTVVKRILSFILLDRGEGVTMKLGDGKVEEGSRESKDWKRSLVWVGEKTEEIKLLVENIRES